MAEFAGVDNHRLYKYTAGPIFGTYLQAYGGVIQEGAERAYEASSTPLIVAPVHRSMLDIPVVAHSSLRAANVQIHFMAASQLWDKPLLGRFIERCGAFPVDRSRPLSAETVAHIGHILNRGSVLGIFPEGARLSGDEVHRKNLKRSIAAIAMKHGASIMPVGIAGTEKGNRGPFRVVYGESFEVAQKDVDLNTPRTFIRESRPIIDELHSQLTVCQARAIELQDVDSITELQDWR